MTLLFIGYAVITPTAFLFIGYAIGRRRDAKVRSEIARVGAMFIEQLEKTKAEIAA